VFEQLVRKRNFTCRADDPLTTLLEVMNPPAL
jgi:hypothetical protein